MNIPLDHLVYAAPDLERGMSDIERLTGVTPALGGQHPGRGTRNALIALGGDAYLEIIAPDPDQPSLPAGRWLGVDATASPRLTAWAVKGHDLSVVRLRAIESGVPLGEVRSGARKRTDGLQLSWELTDPDPLLADGVIPFFIDWGDSPHPSHSAPQGATLVGLHVEHPDAASVRRMLGALELDVRVTSAENAAIVALVEGRHGRVVIR